MQYNSIVLRRVPRSHMIAVMRMRITYTRIDQVMVT